MTDITDTNLSRIAPLPLRLRIVGLSGCGKTYFQTLAGRTDAVITVLCDTDPAALTRYGHPRGIAQFTRFEDLLPIQGRYFHRARFALN